MTQGLSAQKRGRRQHGAARLRAAHQALVLVLQRAHHLGQLRLALHVGRKRAHRRARGLDRSDGGAVGQHGRRGADARRHRVGRLLLERRLVHCELDGVGSRARTQVVHAGLEALGRKESTGSAGSGCASWRLGVQGVGLKWVHCKRV